MAKEGVFTRLNKQRYLLIKKYVAGKKVLDLGVVDHSLEVARDEGWLHRQIVNDAASVTGIDILEKEVKALRTQGFDIRVADAQNFDLKERYDVVVAGELIEHLDNFDGFFRSVRKHLKQGGKLIITTPNSFGLYYFLSNLLKGKFTGNPEHTCWFDISVLRHLLSRFGFKVVCFDYIEMFYPASREAWFTRFPLLRQFWVFLSRFFPNRIKNTLMVVSERI